jgi:hypothetical protein
MEDAPEDMNIPNDAAPDLTARDSSPSFSAAAYVQRSNMTTEVFTQNKPP